MNEKNLSKIPHKCVLNIKAVYSSLKTAEKAAMDYLLQAPNDLIDKTIAEVASAAGCSEATIVRLSKRLGYDGFPELKNDFQEHRDKDSVTVYANVTDKDNIEEIFNKVFDASIEALKDTNRMIDRESLNEAACLINKAENIMFCGLGDAAIVASVAQQRFLRIGKKTFYSLDHDTQLIYASQLEKGDVLVAISYSGRSRPILNTVKVARDAGAKIISITNFPVSPLTKKSDIILQTAVFTQSIGSEVIAKRLTALCIIEGLYLSKLIDSKGTSLEFIEQANNAVAVNKL
ncbi:MAG: MurR/RpiR family transcriptional regulator [Spirochaetota bacterium]|nr:MurR/RpiR family transcriptional regulator [Spirochaetota bacterium]